MFGKIFAAPIVSADRLPDSHDILTHHKNHARRRDQHDTPAIRNAKKVERACTLRCCWM